MSMSESSTAEGTDLRKLDTAYRSFPPFSAWAHTAIDKARWERYAQIMTERGKVSPDVLQKAQQIVTRAAAIDTGAIEGLYEVDRGFTFTVATEAAIWEAAADARGPHVRPMFEAQLAAYEYVLDLATKRAPITEMIIRTLHQELCRNQSTYSVATAVGVQEQPLLKGEYKVAPNHVRGRDGAMHSYAPVDLTPAEMHRLVTELGSEEFIEAHPALQASYAHYAFVSIHPFADGNGRVARALASVFTYRAISVPYLVLFEHRGSYYEALAAADKGNPVPFVTFSLARVLDAITLVDESMRGALVRDPSEAAEALQQLYVTKGGYSHGEVDVAGKKLVEAMAGEFTRIAPSFTKGHISISPSRGGGALTSPLPGFRHPVGEPMYIRIVFAAAPPAEVSLTRDFQIEVPIDCGADDDLTLRNPQTGETFAARVEDVRPAISSVLQMRMNMFANRVISDALVELKNRASLALRQKGYAG
jgi:Fic family protein